VVGIFMHGHPPASVDWRVAEALPARA
jgi:hypothetical protein